MMESADTQRLSQILGNMDVVDDSGLPYFVPHYQREYNWEEEQLDAFFDDIWEQPGGYFIGSIVCIKRENSLEVVDGQQRLMSASLILAALYRQLLRWDEEHKNLKTVDSIQLRESIKNPLKHIKKALLNSDEEGRPRFTPSAQDSNETEYRLILRDELRFSVNLKEPKSQEKRKRQSKKREESVQMAFRHFAEKIDKLCGEQPDLKKWERLQNFYEKLKSANVIQILTKSGSDAFVLFKALNSKGLPLTALDLIKSEIFSKIGESRDDIEVAEVFWEVLLSNVGDDEESERFLRHHATIRPIFENQEEAIGNKVVSAPQLIKKYIEITKSKEALMILEELEESSNLYRKILAQEERDFFEGARDYSGKNFYVEMSLLNEVGGAPSYLLLLYLLRRQKEDLKIPNDTFARIVRTLCQFFVCRHLTNIPDRNQLDRIFFDLVKKIEIQKDLPASAQSESTPKEIESIIEHALIKELSDKSLELFLSSMNDDVAKKKKQITRFVLFYLEHCRRNKERGDNANEDINIEAIKLMKETHGLKKNQSIEHILPKTKSLARQWIDDLGDGNQDRAMTIQTECVHKLGNLTVVGIDKNSRMGGKEFSEKKEILRKSKMEIHAEIVIQSISKWTNREIDNRTQSLIQEFQINFFNGKFKELLPPPKS